MMRGIWELDVTIDRADSKAQALMDKGPGDVVLACPSDSSVRVSIGHLSEEKAHKLVAQFRRLGYGPIAKRSY